MFPLFIAILIRKKHVEYKTVITTNIKNELIIKYQHTVFLKVTIAQNALKAPSITSKSDDWQIQVSNQSITESSMSWNVTISTMNPDISISLVNESISEFLEPFFPVFGISSRSVRISGKWSVSVVCWYMKAFSPGNPSGKSLRNPSFA